MFKIYHYRRPMGFDCTIVKSFARSGTGIFQTKGAGSFAVLGEKRAAFYKISRHISFHAKNADDNGVAMAPLDACLCVFAEVHDTQETFMRNM